MRGGGMGGGGEGCGAAWIRRRFRPFGQHPRQQFQHRRHSCHTPDDIRVGPPPERGVRSNSQRPAHTPPVGAHVIGESSSHLWHRGGVASGTAQAPAQEARCQRALVAVVVTDGGTILLAPASPGMTASAAAVGFAEKSSSLNSALWGRCQFAAVVVTSSAARGVGTEASPVGGSSSTSSSLLWRRRWRRR